MQYFFGQHLFFVLFLFILSAVSSTIVLTLIYKSHENFLPLIHLKADKSHTNASLLGGLSLSASALLVIGSLLFYGSTYLSSLEMLLLKSSILPIIITTLYGYLDDRFEIRARHKLSLQIISVVSFIIPLMNSLYHGQVSFLVLSAVFGLAYINGGNLIDGLDTLFVKIGVATSLGFLALSIQSNSLPAIAISLLICGSLGAFYFFNKEPAKVYAGEIGGSLLGMLLFIQANFLFQTIQEPNSKSVTDLFFKILIVSIYPLCELGITFSRRIFFRQSPFRGDHLHIHHIVKSKFNLKAAKTSNAIASILAITMAIGHIALHTLMPVWSFVAAFVSFSSIYSMTCYRHWKKSYSLENKKEIFMNLNEQMIQVIDGKAIDTFYSKYRPSFTNQDEDTAA